MPDVRNRIEVMHGVNLDQLGRRDPDHYGSLTLTQLEVEISSTAGELGLATRFFHTNHEGEFVEHLHGLEGLADGIILNPGRVDALLLRDPRRLGADRAGGGRGPSVRRRFARGVSPPLGDRRPVLRAGRRPGTRRLSRGLDAAGTRSCCNERARRDQRSRRPAGRAAARHRGRRDRRHQPRQPPLPDRLHRQQRAGRDRPADAGLLHRLSLSGAVGGRGRSELRSPDPDARSARGGVRGAARGRRTTGDRGRRR